MNDRQPGGGRNENGRCPVIPGRCAAHRFPGRGIPSVWPLPSRRRLRNVRATIFSVMSIPAEMPAEVKRAPSSTKWSCFSTWVFGKSSSIQSNERQCVVARLPSRSPAFPSSRAPVHTEARVSTCSRALRDPSDQTPVVHFLFVSPTAGDDEDVQRRAISEIVVREDLHPAGGDDGAFRFGHQKDVERGGFLPPFRFIQRVTAKTS